MLVDASAFVREIGEIAIDLAEHAALQLDDAPDWSPDASTVMRSLRQSNSVALKATAWFGLELLRDDAAASFALMLSMTVVRSAEILSAS